MSIAAPAAGAPAKRGFRLRRVLIGALVVVVIGALADLLGWDITGWFSDLWDTMTTISIEYLLGAIALKTVQTVATAYAWYSILRFAYPGQVRRLDIIAC